MPVLILDTIAMNATTLAVLVAVMMLSIGLVGTAAAAPGEGPPSDMPDAVPDFVMDLLGAISEFIGSVLNAVAGLVEGVVPEGASPSIGEGA